MNWTKDQIDQMTSEDYKQNLETRGDDFRRAVDEAAAQPAARRAGNSVRGAEPAPTPIPTPFDPSFDDVPNDAPSAVAPAATPAATTVDESLPELEYSYQPVSKITGKPVGGLQRFKYRTQDELIQKLAAAHSSASARIRELSRDRKLEEISAAGATPRTQPEKEVPTTVEGLAAELRAQRESNFILSVRAALSEFQASVNWTKFRSEENAKSIVLAVGRAGDDPTDPQSYHRAFANMQQFLEPVPATAAATVEPTPVPAVEQPKAAPAPARNTQRVGIATGLSSADQFSSESPIEPVVQTNSNGAKFYTAAELDRMPSEQMKKLLRNPATSKRIDAVYQEAAARRGR